MPHCYSLMMAKPQCESDEMQAYWDVQIYAKHQEVRVNRVDACIINLKTKQVTTLEMSCAWARNWEEKNEKTLKYRLLQWELKQRYLGYAVPHHNIMRDVYKYWPYLE